jgi:hypothetical protein
MALYASVVRPETCRTLAFGAIGAAYAGIGSAFEHPVYYFMLQNLTDAALMFSWDGINDHFPLPVNGLLIMDVNSNKTDQGKSLTIAKGTRFYTKQLTGAAASGAVYLTVFYAFPD